MLLLLFTLMTLAFIFMWLNHPISMGITIILQTLTVAMITGLCMGSFWYSYIITITMLSGMLVLFIYMASVASNEKFYTSMKLILLSIMLMLTGVIVQMYTENKDYELMNIISNISNESISLNILFNCKFKILTLTMVLYLFFTMITVSFIVNISEGPLRIYKKYE